MNCLAHIRVLLLTSLVSMLAVGCASVPDMETRLRGMQLAPHTYVAQPGDTLSTVAFRYQLDPVELVAMNPNLANGLVVGARVIVHQAPVSQMHAQQGATGVGSQISYNANDRALNGYNGSSQPNSALSAGQQAIAPGAPTNRQIITTGTINRSPVTVQPGGSTMSSAVAHPTQPYPSAEGVVVFDQIREIPASAQLPSNSTRAPIEEVVADELDYTNLPVATDQQLLAGNASDNIVTAPRGNAASGWVWPTWGEVAREFAPTEAGGQGIDIAGVPGQEIHAASGGTVAYAGRDLAGGDSKLIILRHHSGLMTTYSHAQQLFVAEDDVVRAGDVIASLGSNARNESVLRFEVRQHGNPLNPMNFLMN